MRPGRHAKLAGATDAQFSSLPTPGVIGYPPFRGKMRVLRTRNTILLRFAVQPSTSLPCSAEALSPSVGARPVQVAPWRWSRMRCRAAEDGHLKGRIT